MVPARVHPEARRRALIVEQEHAPDQLRRDRLRAQEVLANLTTFCDRVGRANSSMSIFRY